eukprot:5816590-Alexandrium_andersonii.AAC.1
MASKANKQIDGPLVFCVGLQIFGPSTFPHHLKPSMSAQRGGSRRRPCHEVDASALQSFLGCYVNHCIGCEACPFDFGSYNNMKISKAVVASELCLHAEHLQAFIAVSRHAEVPVKLFQDTLVGLVQAGKFRFWEKGHQVWGGIDPANADHLKMWASMQCNKYVAMMNHLRRARANKDKQDQAMRPLSVGQKAKFLAVLWCIAGSTDEDRGMLNYIHNWQDNDESIGGDEHEQIVQVPASPKEESDSDMQENVAAPWDPEEYPDSEEDAADKCTELPRQTHRMHGCLYTLGPVKTSAMPKASSFQRACSALS